MALVPVAFATSLLLRADGESADPQGPATAAPPDRPSRANGAHGAQRTHTAAKHATGDQGREIYMDVDDSNAGEHSARHAELDGVLALLDADHAWSERVETESRTLLAQDPAISKIEAHCVDTFCRLRIVKPQVSKLDWPEIDRLLFSVVQGETIFKTESQGETSTGYIYFSARDSHLPLGNAEPEAQGDGV